MTESAQERRLTDALKSHSAQLEIARIQGLQEKDPDLTVPLSYLDWVIQVRPTIEGRKNIINYLPMYRHLYMDEWVKIMIIFARQMGKSTYLASRAGWKMTTKPNFRGTFVTHEDEALSVFSNEKFRQALWQESPIAKNFIDSKLANAVGFLETKINSSMRLVTHAHNFRHIEGKSVDLLEFDEGNHLNWTKWNVAKESQSFTMGEWIIAGIGGYLNTDYHDQWESTDQRRWKYKDRYWRDKLEFRKSGVNRLVWGDYMLDLCDGLFEITKPENNSFHGYKLNQMDAPWVPLTKSDAIEKYGVPEDYSIEWKQDQYSSEELETHVFANFIQGDLKPLTDSMMFKLFDRTKAFQYPEDVDYSKGKLYMGVDWGGGNKTIPWIIQELDKKQPLFQLIWAEKIETNDVEEQYKIVKDLIDAYKPAQTIVDAGGGTHQVQELQKRYATGVIRNTYLTRPERPMPSRDEDRKLRRENRYEIDRTYSMDRIINLVTRPRLILPAADPDALDWIVEQFTNIEAELVKHKGTGQQYRRYFHQPARADDAFHAMNYAYMAWDLAGSRAVGATKLSTPF